MSVKRYYLIVNVVGEIQEGEVVEINRPSIDKKQLLVRNLAEPPDIHPIPIKSGRVVVAKDKVDMSVQYPGFEDMVPLLNITEAEIPKVVNVVIRPDNRVPIVDKGLIHFLHGIPRTDAVFQDVLMIKMN